MVLPILISGQRRCLVDGCNSTYRVAYGYCNKHYQRLKKHDDLYWPARKERKALPPDQLPNTAGVCLIEGCGIAERLIRGWCMKHYLRWRKHGDPNIVAKQNRYAPNMQCAIDGCIERRYVREWCAKHYRAWYNHGDVLTPDNRVYPPPSADEIERRRKRRANHANRRRAKKLDARVYEYSQEALDARIAYFGARCWMCHGAFSALDHVKPLSKGGKDCPANLRPACKSCNSKKGAKWYGVKGLHIFDYSN
jgi:5-methylcytosine-specific restriction endonuclease McrA